MQYKQIRSHVVAAVLGGLLSLLPALSKADESDASILRSLRCEPVGSFKRLSLILPSDNKQRLVLVHNKTKSPLWLTHPVKNPTVSAGWTTVLAVEKWSAIAVNRPNFELACVEALPGAEQRISCAASVDVCEVHDPVFDQKNGGTYWVTESQRLEKLILKVTRREIKLPHHTA